MEELLLIDGGFELGCGGYRKESKDDVWIPTGIKSQISLDFLKPLLTLEYEDFYYNNYGSQLAPRTKSLGKFSWENQILKLKQINQYRFITNNSDQTTQTENEVEALPCSALIEYSKLKSEHPKHLLKSRKNAEGKTIWYLSFSSLQETPPAELKDNN